MKALVIKVIKFIAYYFAEGYIFKEQSLVNQYVKRSKVQTLDYIDENMNGTLFFHDLEKLWDFTISQIDNPNEGDIFEFGVYKGRSINYLSSKLNNISFFGFDSFDGLKEDWTGTSLPKGHFALNKLPKVNQNVSLIQGWFNETLPSFLDKFKGKLKLIHIDCDTYESTYYVLTQLKERQMLDKGVMILFDEYFGYPGFKVGEMKAFKEVSMPYKYIAFSNKQVLCKII